MTAPWSDRPASFGAPGHADRGDEYEAVLDQLEFVSSGYPTLTRYKAGDTSRSSANTGATYTDDPEMALGGLVANAIYVVELEINITIGAGGFKQQWSWPAGGAWRSLKFAYNNGTVTFAQSWQRLSDATTSPGASVTGVAAGAAGGTPWRFVGTLFMGTTPGTLAWQWAQDASNAANTTVHRGGWFRVQRVA